MKFILIIGNWVKSHIVASIIGIVVIGGTIFTPIILLNSNEESKPKENIEEEVNQDDQEDQEQEPELNEDGCPVGSFKNYYGICQDEHLYEPQECPEGQIWFKHLYINKDNGDGTLSVDYEATFGIDGLPKGGCSDNYDTLNQKLTANGGNGLGLEYKERYDHLSSCPRGFIWISESNSCLDISDRYRSEYEEYVLNKKSE